MKWIKIWTEETIRGTTISELDISDRGIWFTLLALAGDSPDEGFVYLRQGVGYDNDTMAKIINCNKEDIIKTFRKLLDCEKITIDTDGVIAIINWERYQDDYSKYQKSKSYLKENTKKNKRHLKKITSKEVDIERDKDKETTKDKYLEFVFLTKDEHAKLQEKYGTQVPGKIERLNNYIGQSGKRYKSHYHTILNWASKDPVTTQESEKPDPRLRKKSTCCTWSISKKDGKYICNKCEKAVAGFLD